MIENGKPSWPVTKTLFHELGHNTDENLREGVESKQRLQDSALDSGRYYEWTNTIFERLASGERFYKKDDAIQLSQSGYDALAPLGSMLACALGVSEIEFAKIKDKGQDYEAQWLEGMFPGDGSVQTPHGPEVLKRAKEIFDAYELDTDFSLSKKSKNQSLLNEMYQECLSIMERRIEIDLQSNNIQNPEEYKKHQMFFLKKMNVNFKAATKTDGLIFSRAQIVHDIGLCTDELSKKETAKISAEYAAMADFEFDNSTLGKYSKAMTQSTNDRKAFSKSLRVSQLGTRQTPQQENDEAILNPIDKEDECK